MAWTPWITPVPRSAILRLPAAMRTDALNRLSANANAVGGSARQTNGRSPSTAARGLRNALGIYLIESNPTGPYAASVGGATPATITVEGGTPASTAIATNELDAVTWVAPPGPRSMTVAINTNEVLGNAKVRVG